MDGCMSGAKRVKKPKNKDKYGKTSVHQLLLPLIFFRKQT